MPASLARAPGVLHPGSESQFHNLPRADVIAIFAVELRLYAVGVQVYNLELRALVSRNSSKLVGDVNGFADPEIWSGAIKNVEHALAAGLRELILESGGGERDAAGGDAVEVKK